jgi:poly(3-hydroxybutyrate) depolymerase
MTGFRALALLLLSGLALTACDAGEGEEEPGVGGTDGSGGDAPSSGSSGVSGAAVSGAAGVAATAGTEGGGGAGTSAGGTYAVGKGGLGGFGGKAPGFGGKGAGKGGFGGKGTTESGCAAGTWPTAGEHELVVDGVRREFTLALPSGYDPNRRYPVIFSWHGLGGAMGNYYQLNSSARAGDSALHLSPQGLDNANGDGAGWWNTDGRDLAFVDALIAWTEGSFCVDDARLFSVGFSSGAMFSHLLACERGGEFRAIAPIAGSFYDYYGLGAAPYCKNPVPVLGIHGSADDRVPLADGERARDVWVQRNGCAPEAGAAEPEGCVLYQGCTTGYPVEWCTHDGTHMVPSFAADVIWAFFSSF